MQAIAIQNMEVPVIEYHGKRVVTLAMVDKVHGRPEGTARRGFNENRIHFIEGEDFFQTTPSVLREHFVRTTSEIPVDKLIPLQGRGVTLLTESGYLMLVKSFRDDLSYQVQRELVKAYFREKENAASGSLGEALLKCVEGLVALDARVQELTNRLEATNRLPAGDKVRPWDEGTLRIAEKEYSESRPLWACTPGARSLWLDMVSLMRGAQPYGHLAVNGKPMSMVLLARMVGQTVEALEPLLDELETAGIFGRTEEGIIYSPRMLSDERRRDAWRARQRRHRQRVSGTAKRKRAR